MTARRCWGVFRELAHSPGRETDDALILKETARRLGDRGFSVELKTVDDLPEPEPDVPPALFVMCERIPVLDRLARWETRGALVVNPTAGIRNTYRDRTATLFAAAGVPFPASVLVPTDDPAPAAPSGSRDLAGLWIKRGDVHATEAADVMRAESTSGALAALAEFRRRGVSRALLQEHVPGDLIKFYGVDAAGASSGVDAAGGPEGGGGWFEWFYHRDQVLARHPFDAAVLEAAARKAAAALRLEVWGGDAIVGPDGAPVVIDLNAWPSFALYRDRAADAIAARLAARFEPAASMKRIGVTE
jgi:hypothetical protein